MELTWTKDIDDNDFTYFQYNCKPIVFDSKLFYAFHTIDRENINIRGYFGTKIIVIIVNLIDETSIIKQISFKYKEPSKKEILLSSDWRFILNDNKIYLYTGIWLDITQTKISIADINYKLEEFRVKTEYEFQNKTLKYNQLSTIECFDKNSKNPIWKVKIKGYIYTDIELQKDCLIFGTAGKGGALYCIQLTNGKVLTELSNSNTSNYAWHNDTIILRDLKGNLQQVNPFTCEIIKKLELKDKLFYAPILADNEYVYTTVHNKKLNRARLICVRNKE